MSLAKYKKMRQFDRTPEPAGQVKSASSKQFEFVVQKHHASHLHYDFRLEMAGVLKSWAVPKGPSLSPHDKRLAMMVEDHPYQYRKFEGVIPKGNYGAGNVIIWDRGTYEARDTAKSNERALQAELEKGHLTFILHGQKLKGEFALVKTPARGETAWLLIKKDDEFASAGNVLEQAESVVSGRQVDDLAAAKIDLSGAPRAAMPTQLKPMLATLTDGPFDKPDWLYEIKWDGYRAIGSWDGSAEQLYSRNGNSFDYGSVREALRQLEHNVILDGEVIAVDKNGKANFGWLQNWGKHPQGELLYCVFDILWCDGHNLMDLTLSKRKQILKKIVPADSVMRYSDHIEGRGIAFFEAAAKQKLEGVMAKNASSRYQPGLRSRQWLKIKTHQRQEAVIGGFTEPRGSRQHIGALILGVYEGGRLRYIGHIGGGIPPKLMPSLLRELKAREVSRSPFDKKFKPNAPAHWVRPELVCEIEFSEWTGEGHMRQPIFVGLRTDKTAQQVTPEKSIKPAPAKSKSRPAPAQSAGRVEFSHRDKIFFPQAGYTKGQLIDYYQSVSSLMLPYIEDRPHSLLRQPNGITGQAFFQKDMDHMPPAWVKTEAIFSESNNKDINYLVVDSPDSLLYMVQLGCIEINPWNSRLSSLAKPDWCVIDLDPENIDFKEVVKAANFVHEICDQLKIPSYPKASGKTGIHIYIPLVARYSYEQCKQFAQLLATMVNQRLPETTSLERSPKKRQHKIYIDYLQNRAGQTLAAPYSVRPTPVASVSAPLNWEEVNDRLDPASFTIKSMGPRLAQLGDLWQPVIGAGVDINKVLAAIDDT